MQTEPRTRPSRLLSAVWTLMLAAALTASGCATTGLSDAQELALYREHAKAPVRDFRYGDRLHGWNAIGDNALAVWTRPNEAYLLELDTGCTDLGSTTTILITNMLGQVSAGLDRVRLIDGPRGFNIACRIQTIRPLETKALRASQKALREARLGARDAGKP
jgi:hypothetical protein